MLLAVGILLPYITAHGLGLPGTVLLPMHIPVLLCGFLCGPARGAMLGLLLPVLSSVLTGMPSLYPMAPIMAVELMTYGLVTGLLYHKTKLGMRHVGIYLSLLIAMVCGRVMYGLTFQILFAISGELKALTVWAAAVTGLPGIMVQVLLVPPVVMAVNHHFEAKQNTAIQSAVHLIEEGRATCLVIKDNIIVKSESGRGIAPVIRLYESGILQGAYVVDKIVGKAAAMVMTLGGVRGCHAVTVSQSALDWFAAHGIPVTYDTCAAYIVNRQGDGICPMEGIVGDIDDAEAALPMLKAEIAARGISGVSKIL